MIDQTTLGAVIGIVKQIPGTATQIATQAAQDAQNAQEAAETAAELAATRNYGVSVSGTSLVFTQNTQ